MCRLTAGLSTAELASDGNDPRGTKHAYLAALVAVTVLGLAYAVVTKASPIWTYGSSGAHDANVSLAVCRA